MGGGAPPELVVDAYLSVSMLYARRYEAQGSDDDLALALHYLDEARRHVVAGSFADLQVRMSTAAWLMVRFQAHGRRRTSTRRSPVWSRLLDSDAGALAAANLGRALLARHELTGDGRRPRRGAPAARDGDGRDAARPSGARRRRSTRCGPPASFARLILKV